MLRTMPFGRVIMEKWDQVQWKLNNESMRSVGLREKVSLKFYYYIINLTKIVPLLDYLRLWLF